MSLIDIPTDGTVSVVGFASDGTLDEEVTTLPSLLSDLAQQSWSELRGQLSDALRNRLNGQRIAEGMNLYDVVVTLAADCAMSIGRTPAGDLQVSVVTGRNTVIASTTTDSWFGSYADPRFSLDFGLAFAYDIDLPPVAGPITVTGFRDLRITMPHVDSQNLVGDIALFFVAVVEFFTGWNLDGTLARMLDGLDLADRANGVLAPVNDAVTALASKGFAYLAVLAGDPADLARQLGPWGAAAVPALGGLPGGTQSLLLVCRKPDTSGVIEGEIAWAEDQGGPVDRRLASVVSSIASVQLAPDLVARAAAGLEAAQVSPTRWRAELAGGDALSPDLEQTAVAVAALPAAGTFQLAAISRPEAIQVWDAGQRADPGFEPTDLPAAVHGTAFEALLGSRAVYEAITDEFRRGPDQFDLLVKAADAAGGHATGRLVGTWYDDSDGWCRRRYRIENVETDVALQVSCALAGQYVWRPEGAVDIAPRNWDGVVTVHPPIEFGRAIRDGSLQATVTLAGGERRTASLAALEAAGAVRRPDGGDRSIIVVGGMPGDEAALNPQPLPPRVLEALRDADRGGAVLVELGREGDEASLNPQPLPPRWREALQDRFDGSPVVIRSGGGGVGGRIRRGVGGSDAVGGLADRLGHLVDEFSLERLGGSIGRLAGRLRAGRWGRGEAEQVRERTGWEADVPFGRRGRRIERQVPAAESAIEVAVDRFGDVTVTALDPDVFIPDVHNPSGHGTVRGVDFRVRRA